MAHNYFGTDGIRGIANEVLTATIAFKVGRYIAQYPNGKKNKIILARDSRVSGDLLAHSLIAGMLASGGDVYYLDLSTTPSISYLVEAEDFDYGIMISASHNPYYDNGIKIFNKKGEKLENEVEHLIEDYIDSIKDYLPLAKNEDLGKLVDGNYLKEKYLSFLASKARNLDGLNVLFDCANGSASDLGPILFKKLNINATFIHNAPNGLNINDRCGSTHLQDLIEHVKNGHYDIAFAFDGDADRLMCVAKDGTVVDGDRTIYLNALDMKKNKSLHDNKVVITVMSNLGLKKALQRENIDIIEVGVGDKYVQAALRDKHLSLGGEQSGHVIFLDDLNTGDGMLTAIKIMNIYKNDNQLFNYSLESMKIYPQDLKNIVVTNKEAIMSNNGLKQLIELKEKELDGDGRILVRPSGTEPLIRVMCEAKNKEICKEVCDSIINYIHEISF